MNKIIVLNDEAFDSLVGTLKQAMDDSKCLADWLNAKAHAELIESQKEKKRSVIEWHKYPDEKPKKKGYYYFKFKDCPRICEILTDENDTILEDGEFWAEPPKVPSED
jgi:hypothetical protein